ncbi:MAG TPA: hypothetical protein VGG27_13440 [Magnetospirillaceae bacterium]|jgi:hypothetical protein
MSDLAELRLDDDAGAHEMGSPLLWWRRYEPRTIIERRHDLLAEVSTATRGLIDDSILNAALGGSA